MIFESSIDISAPAPAVWSIMERLEQWPDWAPTFRSVQRVRSPAGVGAAYRVEQPRLPPSIMTVTRWEPGRGFTWASRSAMLGARGEHDIEPMGANACRVHLALRFEGLFAPVAGRLMRRMVAAYVDSEATALKRRAEGPSA
ncbi:SRPBCC family protein [Ramlibacter humi]|uniref:SRPBCC family protein n=1 Tax=Ramlibacter humi TaxID=2530451 RepID=UPI00143065A2|nr:SRPBCC family protein [Ramlibacter humi]